MLKSTHKPVGPASEPALPPGWTRHKAPSGHSYYYNAETKQSTYTRPTVVAEAPLHIDYSATQPGLVPLGGFNDGGLNLMNNGQRGQGHFRGGRSYQDRSRRQQEDRPKSKAAVPNFEPWFLVKTKYGRRFVYNSETKESFWKFPQDVMMAVIEMDKLEWEAKKNSRVDKTETAKTGPDKPEAVKGSKSQTVVQPEGPQDDDSDSYEEVEVTDDEDENADPSSKRPRIEEEVPSGPVEFNEEDIAFQLAQMGEDYGLDPDEYENPDEDYDDGDEGLELSEKAAVSLFENLLDDSGISPYSTFDKLIEDTSIVDDNRYTVLPNMARRREVFSEWSTDRIQRLQEKRSKQQSVKKDPKIAYLRFLGEHASTKLYWPEFKRKFRKEDVMKDLKVSDKDREKLYRELATKLKTNEGDRKKDLLRLLRDAPSTQLHRDSSLVDMPEIVEKDLRFWAVPGRVREELFEAHISTLKAVSD